MSSISSGFYRHYKGKVYMVLAIAKHSETLENLIMYRAMYDDEKFGPYAYWVRPVEMFLEEVEVDGQMVPRFTRMDDLEAIQLVQKDLNIIMGNV
jgi:hypothetical protein